MSVRARSSWNLEVLHFEERGKPKHPVKDSWNNEDNLQQTHPTYGVNARIWTRPTVHSAALPLLPRKKKLWETFRKKQILSYFQLNSF